MHSIDYRYKLSRSAGYDGGVVCSLAAGGPMYTYDLAGGGV